MPACHDGMISSIRMKGFQLQQHLQPGQHLLHNFKQPRPLMRQRGMHALLANPLSLITPVVGGVIPVST